CNYHHVLLKFLYLGWDYQGYVTQEDTINTIEHHIFEALKKTCLIEDRASSNYHRCGRTDKGARTYKYFFPKGRLDIEQMKFASNYLVGTHDFRNFCKMDVNNGVVEFIRTISSIEIKNFSTEIRCILGILILIGQNKEKPEVVLELLDIANHP
ncbi:tRNA pseudouridine(38/39) synthase, partial [Asbolus verrucosus]